MKRKLIALLFALSALAVAFCFSSCKDKGDDKEIDKSFYELTADGSGYVLRIPIMDEGQTSFTVKETHEGKPVVGIGSFAFSDREVKSVSLPNGLLFIENAAFHGSAIESIVIPDSVTSIGNQAFENCKSLKTAVIGEGVKSIPDRLFCGASTLEQVSYGENVERIGNEAFYGTAIDEIYFPQSLQAIGGHAFVDCDNLTSVVVPDSVQSMDGGIFQDCDNLVELTIPFLGDARDDEFGGSLTWLFDYNAQEVSKSLKKVTLTGGSNLEGGAFSKCKYLEEVVLPDSMDYVSQYAFENCYGLKTINIPENVTRIGASAFENCYNLMSVRIPESVTYVDGFAFKNCHKLIEVQNLSSLTSSKLKEAIEYDAPHIYSDGESYLNTVDGIVYYVDSKYVRVMGRTGEDEKVIIPATPNIPDFASKSGYYVHQYAFYNDEHLKEVEIGANSVFEYAFSGCTALERITMSEGAYRIEEYAFEGTAITEFTVPYSTEFFNARAFSSCGKLARVTFADSESSWVTTRRKTGGIYDVEVFYEEYYVKPSELTAENALLAVQTYDEGKTWQKVTW